MRVLFLDDDPLVLRDGLADLEPSDYRVDKCLSIPDAEEALAPNGGAITDEDVVLFVDHDLGAGQDGYTFVEWVRRNHPRGHLLPIVYLTGRESERGFLDRLASVPYHSPSMYLSKRDLARPAFDINVFLRELISKYKDGLIEIDRQRLDESMRFFEAHGREHDR